MVIPLRSLAALALLLVVACSSTESASEAPAADAGSDAVADASVDHRHLPIDAGAPPPPVTGPDHLADTGLYKDFASRTLADGILSFEPRYPLWSDGADKTRYILLPPGMKIDTSRPDDWIFPVGTKVWKEFRIGPTLVETRLLWKVRDGQDGWWESAYAWTSDGSDAVATVDGVPNALGTSHDVPSQQDCTKCHANVADVLIGLGAIQLGASDGDGTLAKLAAAGWFTAAPPKASYDAPGAGVVKEALGYLHGNCGHCHNDLGALERQTPLRLRLRVSDDVAEQTPPYTTGIGLNMVHHFATDAGVVSIGIVPGSPETSELWWRMTQRNALAMPPVCTKVVDDTGVVTIHDWIAQMPCGVRCTTALQK
jgi:hypothetical protein